MKLQWSRGETGAKATPSADEWFPMHTAKKYDPPSIVRLGSCVARTILQTFPDEWAPLGEAHGTNPTTWRSFFTGGCLNHSRQNSTEHKCFMKAAQQEGSSERMWCSESTRCQNIRPAGRRGQTDFLSLTSFLNGIEERRTISESYFVLMQSHSVVVFFSRQRDKRDKSEQRHAHTNVSLFFSVLRQNSELQGQVQKGATMFLFTQTLPETLVPDYRHDQQNFNQSKSAFKDSLQKETKQNEFSLILPPAAVFLKHVWWKDIKQALQGATTIKWTQSINHGGLNMGSVKKGPKVATLLYRITFPNQNSIVAGKLLFPNDLHLI